MKKDAYYFPHFCNARNDQKIIKLRRVLGLEGYAIYFMLLEILREQTDWKYPIDGLNELEFELRVSKEKISSVILNYDLFIVDADRFFSPKLIHYLQPYIEKTEKARLAANIRWNKNQQIEADFNENAGAMQMHSVSNARKGKERKGKESKGEQIMLPHGEPFATAWSEWIAYRKERRLTCTARTLSGQIRLLSGLNEPEAVAVINQSIVNGWQGLFELKTKQLNNGKQQINIKDELSGIYNR
jgi:hypothetical protein